jgi:hypothetical protein
MKISFSQETQFVDRRPSFGKYDIDCFEFEKNIDVVRNSIRLNSFADSQERNQY